MDMAIFGLLMSMPIQLGLNGSLNSFFKTTMNLVSPHHDAGQLPALLEVLLKPLVGPVSAYRKTYSSLIQSQTKNWITSLCLFEAEEMIIKADYTLTHIAVNGFSDAPSLAGCLNHELAGYMMLVHERSIGGFMEFTSAPNAVRSLKNPFHHAEKVW